MVASARRETCRGFPFWTSPPWKPSTVICSNLSHLQIDTRGCCVTLTYLLPTNSERCCIIGQPPYRLSSPRLATGKQRSSQRGILIQHRQLLTISTRPRQLKLLRIAASYLQFLEDVGNTASSSYDEAQVPQTRRQHRRECINNLSRKLAAATECLHIITYTR